KVMGMPTRITTSKSSNVFFIDFSFFVFFSAHYKIVWKQNSACLTPLGFNNEPNYRIGHGTYHQDVREDRST
ncbi:MAG: hypothetical protein JXK93_04605, partial [Sphaerochaetaceae bacterium]|nr:hypothetical protein [Sphaerochaetaceae bacterium]